jgi:tetratricopeptide (TPR) repeat protein
LPTDHEQRKSDKEQNPLPAEELIAYCLLKLDRNREAEAFAARNKSTYDDGEGNEGGKGDSSHVCRSAMGYYHGIASARQGKTESAVENLGAAVQDPYFSTSAKEALVTILKKRAEQRIAVKNWSAAAEDLALASNFKPEDPDLNAMITAIGHHLPITYVKTNKRSDAAAFWEKSQRENLDDFRITHCLTLLYYWNVEEFEHQGKIAEADNAWIGLIRNMVALCHADRFWAELKAEREKIYAHIPPEALTAIRKRLQNELSRKLLDYHGKYSKQHSSSNARRIEKLMFTLSLERKTAEILAHIVEHAKKTNLNINVPMICGPEMANRLGITISLAQLQISGVPESKDLKWCFSQCANAWIMIQEKQYQKAIEELKAYLKTSNNSEANDLLALACFERGAQLVESGGNSEALRVFKEACGYIRQDMVLREKIKKQAEDTAIKESKQLYDTNTRTSVNSAIAIMQDLKSFNSSKRVDETLANYYTRLSAIEYNDESQSEYTRNQKAVELVEKALSLDPSNGQAKENKGYLLANKGIDEVNAGRKAEGVRLLRQAYSLAPGLDRARNNLCEALLLQAADELNRGNRYSAKNLIEEAYKVNPNNATARELYWKSRNIY